ncbi:FAD-binding oxidoreductase [Shimia sp.]|uniref:NAD(P)/FAD-dependent oxidoreductase n=1 Tax=Shimia sp. TaxID=1954381 RepID=UPI003297A619
MRGKRVTGDVIRRLPRQTGPAAWNVILGPQPEPERLETDKMAEFVVIGAGFSGLSAARRLRQLHPHARIVVLEAGRVAAGASGRNSGFMMDLPHTLTARDHIGTGDDPTLIALNRQAQAFGHAAVQAYDIAPDFFDPAGKVIGAAGPKSQAHNESYAAHLDGLGEPYEMLDAAHMRELTGSDHYLSGLYTPGTVMLQPAGYIRGLAAGLQREDVEIYENSPVLSFRKQGLSWRINTPKGSVEIGRVILSVNGHLESFGFARNRLKQMVLFAAMTPELSPDELTRLGGRPRWGITPAEPMGTTIRRIDAGQGGQRIVTQTCAVLRPGLEAKPSDLNRATKVIQRKFDQRFPQLAGIDMEHVWAGQVCLSQNNVSVMQEVETGIYSGCVQNGLGTARGTLTGIGAAEMACGHVSDITDYFGNQAAPTPLAPRPFREIGANAALRLREWGARAE